MLAAMRSCLIGPAFVLGALVLVAAACGGSDAVPAEQATASDAEAATPTAIAESSEGDDETAGSGSETIEDYLGTAALALRGGLGRGGAAGAGGFGGIDTEQIAQEQQLIELEVQRCMQAQGFEYVPEDTTGALRFFAAAGQQGISDADYAATEGFGISTAFDALFAGDVSLTDDEPSPNDALLETLSEGEVEAWQFALRGEPPVRNEQGQLVDPDTGEPLQGGPGQATGGCRLDAQLAVRGDLTLLGDLSDAWDTLEERIEADARIAEIRRAWAACMLDRGFDYQSADEARADFQAQMRPLMRSFAQSAGFSGGQQGEGGQQPGAGNGRTAIIQAIADQGLSDEQEAELQALQDLEIAAAVASLECSDDTDAEIAEIRARYEATFVEENRGLLEQFAG